MFNSTKLSARFDDVIEADMQMNSRGAGPSDVTAMTSSRQRGEIPRGAGGNPGFFLAVEMTII